MTGTQLSRIGTSEPHALNRRTPGLRLYGSRQPWPGDLVGLRAGTAHPRHVEPGPNWSQPTCQYTAPPPAFWSNGSKERQFQMVSSE